MRNKINYPLKMKDVTSKHIPKQSDILSWIIIERVGHSIIVLEYRTKLGYKKFLQLRFNYGQIMVVKEVADERH
jgi:hypothetical protein